jgi:hypothetical protein
MSLGSASSSRQISNDSVNSGEVEGTSARELNQWFSKVENRKCRRAATANVGVQIHGSLPTPTKSSLWNRRVTLRQGSIDSESGLEALVSEPSRRAEDQATVPEKISRCAQPPLATPLQAAPSEPSWLLQWPEVSLMKWSPPLFGCCVRNIPGIYTSHGANTGDQPQLQPRLAQASFDTLT